MITYTDPQGSEAWLASRRGVITASRFRDARSKLKNGSPSSISNSYANDLAREQAGGSAYSVFENGAMRIGTEEEPKARSAY